MRRILFVDLHDTSLGPMAEALAEAYGFDAESVGLEPGLFVPDVVERVMASKGLHVRGHRPHWMDLHHMHADYDRIIALGDVRGAPVRFNARWNIPDPEGKGPAAHDAARRELERQIKALARDWT